jgi:obg-like ATPase 1
LALQDAEIIHVEDRVDPVEDLTIINGELRTKDLEFLNSRHDALKKMVSRGLDKQQKVRVASHHHTRRPSPPEQQEWRRAHS